SPEQITAAVAVLAGPWEDLRQRHRRHDGYRALVGGLLRAGLPALDVEALVTALAEATQDEEAEKRVALVPDTAARLAVNQPASGWPKLADLLGVEGEALVQDVQERLGVRRIIAVYDYVDEAGCLKFQTVRFSPKDFSQRRPDGKDWVWNLA